MKTFLLLASLLITLAACSNNSDNTQATNDNTQATNVTILNPNSGEVKTVDTLCFERYSGLQKQDTASVSIIIAGNEVSGRYANYPYQKDSRVGTIAGIKSGNVIKGSWRFQQEGMTDTVGFEFKLEGNSLWQKQTNYDTHTGRELLSDTAAFSLEFIKLNCEKMKLPVRQM